MLDPTRYLEGLIAMLVAATIVWVVSVAKRDASIVDGLWGPLFVLGALAYAWPVSAAPPRGACVLALLTVWAVRLSVHVVARNRGHGEDYRYREIRRRNEPNFALKSLWLVFWLQAMLAWLISLPLLAAQTSAVPMGLLDGLGFALAVFGLAFETVADRQLARFRRDPANRGQVLDRGLWRYTRHPNYFGEACVWWGFGLVGVAAGAWWSLVSSVLITWLLLRVSGVALLERTIGERRPAYAAYVRRTSAFVPWPRRRLPRGDAVVDLEA